MRTIKPKEIQVHHECICGLNITQTEYIPIKWNDFKAAGIKRITDVKTKKRLSLKPQNNCCQKPR